jgi:hypothetical protein
MGVRAFLLECAGPAKQSLLAGRPSAESREWILFVVTADHSMISWAGNQQ